MERIIDRKSLLLMGKVLANPEYKRAFIIAIMNDEDYEELRNLYIKLDKKDKEIENNLYNIIYDSREKERKPALKAEEKLLQSFEKLSMFGLTMGMYKK